MTLWAFSLASYRRPGVAATCHFLQDEAGLNVNVLLWACWLGVARRHGPTSAELAEVLVRLADWHDRATAPLRLARRALKDNVPAVEAATRERIREKVKTLELACEKVEQNILLSASCSGDIVAGRDGTYALIRPLLTENAPSEAEKRLKWLISDLISE